MAREQHYREFEQRVLRPNEDPSLFVWNLRQLLDRADPDLTEDVKTALLSRQFMKGLPTTLRLRLLESDHLCHQLFRGTEEATITSARSESCL